MRGGIGICAVSVQFLYAVCRHSHFWTEHFCQYIVDSRTIDYRLSPMAESDMEKEYRQSHINWHLVWSIVWPCASSDQRCCAAYRLSEVIPARVIISFP